MKIYCMSDIHGCIYEFEDALSLVLEHLDEEDTMLCLMGDYIHGGHDSYAVLDRIMKLQDQYGQDKVLALLGNHEEFVLFGSSSISEMVKDYEDEFENDSDEDDHQEEKYISWMESLPTYFICGNTIFVHAGIDEEAGDLWEWGTSEETFIGKYPAEVGPIKDLDMKVVAGHVGTAEISGNPRFHDIFYDGYSHYYIDGTVLDSGVIPVLMVDTTEDKYYRITDAGETIVLPYEDIE